jgi:hypothetical protein
MKTISGLGVLFVVALMGFAVLAQDTGNALSGKTISTAPTVWSAMALQATRRVRWQSG